MAVNIFNVFCVNKNKQMQSIKCKYSQFLFATANLNDIFVAEKLKSHSFVNVVIEWIESLPLKR